VSCSIASDLFHDVLKLGRVFGAKHSAAGCLWDFGVQAGSLGLLLRGAVYTAVQGGVFQLVLFQLLGTNPRKLDAGPTRRQGTGGQYSSLESEEIASMVPGPIPAPPAGPSPA
jgi:hypothetical protein